MQEGKPDWTRFDPKPLLAKFDGQPLPASATEGLQLQSRNGRGDPRLQTDI